MENPADNCCDTQTIPITQIPDMFFRILPETDKTFGLH